jgi:hypothetical protein
MRPKILLTPIVVSLSVPTAAASDMKVKLVSPNSDSNLAFKVLKCSIA